MSLASFFLKWWVTYTWLWHRVSWENKATKATNALQTQWPQKKSLASLAVSWSLPCLSCSLQLNRSVSFCGLKRDLKWPAHVPTGGFRLIHVGAAAELRTSCLNMSRQMKGGAEQTDGTDQCCIFIPLKWECDARIHQGVLQSQGNNKEERRVTGKGGGVVADWWERRENKENETDGREMVWKKRKGKKSSSELRMTTNEVMCNNSL